MTLPEEDLPRKQGAASEGADGGRRLALLRTEAAVGKTHATARPECPRSCRPRREAAAPCSAGVTRALVDAHGSVALSTFPAPRSRHGTTAVPRAFSPSQTETLSPGGTGPGPPPWPQAPAPHCLRPFTWGLTQHSACVRLLSRSLTPRGLSVLCRGPLLSEAEPRSTAWVDPGVGPTTGCRAPGNAHLGSRGLSSQVALLSSAFGGAHVSSPRVTPASASVALPHRGLHRTLGISAPGGPDLAHSCGKTAERPVSAARPREPGWPQTSAGRHRA